MSLFGEHGDKKSQLQVLRQKRTQKEIAHHTKRTEEDTDTEW